MACKFNNGPIRLVIFGVRKLDVLARTDIGCLQNDNHLVMAVNRHGMINKSIESRSSDRELNKQLPMSPEIIHLPLQICRPILQFPHLRTSKKHDSRIALGPVFT